MAQTQITLTVDTTPVDDWLAHLKSAVAANAELCRSIEGLIDIGGELWDIKPATLIAGELTVRVEPRADLAALLEEHGVVLDG